MDLGLTGKTALITGSTKGIGKAIAIEMAKEGTNVIINGRKKADVDTIVSEIKEQFPDTNPQGAAYDISQSQQRQELFAAFPKIDILVNNMGIFKPMDYFDISEETWQHFIDVNFYSGNALAKFYLPKMLVDMYSNTDVPENKWESDFMKNHRPLSQIQRLIRPEEVGRFTAFVASPYSSSFSGEALRLDGGLVPTLF